jgi:hypothetical protein
MLLGAKDIDEFRQIYEEEYQESITTDEAREMATRLLQLYEVLLEAAHRLGPLENERLCDIVDLDGDWRPS